MNSSSIPPFGCPSSIDPRYFTLCDLKAVWGIVVEAVAGAGILTSFLLLVIMVASLPFVTDKRRKSVLALQVSFIIFSLGVFGLSLAFIVGEDSTTCIARRFVFGVMFAGCFACLLMHGLWLVLLDRHKTPPKGCLFWLGGLGIWLVEIIINTEWIIIIQMDNGVMFKPDICNIKNDFTMALIYVMILLVAVVLLAVPSMIHTHKSFRQDALYILVTGILSICIWMVWIVMYIHGNKMSGHSNWDNATLAIALVSNGWVFLIMYTIPELCALNQVTENMDEVSLESQNSTRCGVYENITDMNVESPYNGYVGRSCLYQPTELALISKGPGNISQEGVLPRATAPPLVPSSRGSLPREG
ncbi:G-protein coupled receptor family C group 5 member C-like [Astyanax mexicanus]|uniref:G-protein coupled receptor family C group 5 member C-like n=1 Tax=Astyanax mexicanus TaxID=7994 RepID=UPI0020CAC40F|nr:G-protein coupled receptor family C group 5 member C-like [Astyanax mexicanus]